MIHGARGTTTHGGGTSIRGRLRSLCKKIVKSSGLYQLGPDQVGRRLIRLRNRPPMTRAVLLLPSLALLVAGQASPGRSIAGTIDGVVSEAGRAFGRTLNPSADRSLPGVTDKDRVFRGQLKVGGAGSVLQVAFVERASGGGLLFVDRNLDGRLTGEESVPVTPGTGPSAELAFDLGVLNGLSGGQASAFPLSARCGVLTTASRQYAVECTVPSRVEGHADIDGRRTLVSIPFDPWSERVDIRYGRIAMDANGDGRIDFSAFSSAEVVWADGKPALFRVGSRVVSVESVDMTARTFVLREHPSEAYKYVELRVGDVMPAFTFTDFEGRVRRLSDFRGRYLLLDFWGTWCGPCLAEFPTLRTARERFADRGFEILGIDYEKGGATLDHARDVARGRGATWPNAAPDTVKELVEDVLRITGFPTKILIGPDGRVVAWLGFDVTGDQLLKRLDSLIR